MSAHDLYADLQDATDRIYELEFQLANLDTGPGNDDLAQDLKKKLQKAKDFKMLAEAAIKSLNDRG